jgi:hypothetical protein
MRVHPRLLLALLLFLAAPGHACTFTWTNPTTHTDGSPLTDLAGTVLYFEAVGTTGGLPQSPEAPVPSESVTLKGPCQVGTYWAEAYTRAGDTSAPSNLVPVTKGQKGHK